MALRMAALAIWLWLLVRLLPATDFGWLASLLAVNSICALFSQAGIPYLFFFERQLASRSDNRWREALGAILIITPLIALIGFQILPPTHETPWRIGLIYAFMIADIGLTALVQTLALRGHATGSIRFAAAPLAFLAIARAAAAGILTSYTSQPSADGLELYLALHLTFSFAATLISFKWIGRHLTLRLSPTIPRCSSLKETWKYSTMGGSSLLSSELDKPLSARALGLAASGHYALAYRICAMLTTPSTAFAAVLVPRWARMAGESDSNNLRATFWHAFFITALLGCMAALLLRTLAPVLAAKLPTLLYDEAWQWLRNLCWLIPLLSLHQITSAALLAIGRPLHRSGVDILAFAVLLVAFGLSLPHIGAQALILACILAESFAVLSGTLAFLHSINTYATGPRHEKR